MKTESWISFVFLGVTNQVEKLRIGGFVLNEFEFKQFQLQEVSTLYVFCCRYKRTNTTNYSIRL